MTIPDLLIIGAEKAASTTLNKYLSLHPQIFMGPKEINFFSANYQYNKGLEWYQSLFNDAQPGQLCGEATTQYTAYPQFPNVPERIYHFNPQVKLIYLMRNPVDRAYSHYVHFHRNIPNARKIEGFLMASNECLNYGEYMMQISQYLSYFPRESFFFLITEEFIADPIFHLKKICQFLEIDETFSFVSSKPIYANKSVDGIERRAKNMIAKKIKSIPLFNKLVKVFPKSVRHYFYENLSFLPSYNSNKTLYQRSPMLPETRQYLQKYYQQPNQELSEFLNKDLSLWD